MKNYVIINGTNSNTITGLMINELPPISKPQMRTMIEEIDGRDGDIITDLGYSSYDKTFTIGLFGTGYDINEIISFFNDSGTITFSNEPDKYYYFKAISKIDYERLQKFKTATITFHCQPYKYPTSETPIEISYEYVEQENVESANMTNTEGDTFLKISPKGNTSQTGTPTPSSPIPVNVVSGDNTITVCGKNLLNISNDNVYINALNNPDITTTYNQNKTTYKVNSIPQTHSQAGYYYAFHTRIGETYKVKVKWENIAGDSIANVRIMGDTGETIIVNNMTSNTEYTFIATQNTYYFRVWVKTAIGEGYIENPIISTIDTTYKPYTSQTYPIYLGVENILNPTATTQTLGSGGTLTKNSDGTYTASGGNSGIADLVLLGTIDVINGETYYLRNDFASNNDNLSIRRGTTVLVNTTSQTSVSYTATASETLNIYLRYQNTETLTYKPMVSKTQASRYTQYGKAIELCKISTYQDYFTKNSGKNLFDKDSILSGYELQGSTGEVVANATWYVSDYIKVEPNKRYYLSGNRTSGGSICRYDENKQYLSFQGSTITGIIETLDAEYIRFNGLLSELNNNIQIELGETATTYEPYGTNQWCKYNAIGKVVLDGSETWSTWTSNRITTYLAGYKKVDNSTISLLYSNYYQRTSRSNSSTNNSMCFYSNTESAEGIIVCDSVNNTSELLKVWLSTHNTTIYYVLENPYLSLITDNTLINQLDNIENAFSYEGTTNVNQTNNDKPFLLDLKAMKKDTNETIVNNIGNTTSKPTIALEGTGDINIYLNGTQMLKATLTDKMTIDTNNMEAYNPDTSALLNRYLVGDISKFTLSSGNNTIKMDGDLTKATITDYVRWL